MLNLGMGQRSIQGVWRCLSAKDGYIYVDTIRSISVRSMDSLKQCCILTITGGTLMFLYSLQLAATMVNGPHQ
ncbi:hypothetical protein VN97_g7473 [Penicillium thymicola]|uniref:Uncharacterized protein n=1 Tax=Penicillium thymicola TaxID=293382 RepID=A0AAI9X6T9_PENTH|nr:hypothetical protein VN97_g7473 [Penicillium thymicola]